MKNLVIASIFVGLVSFNMSLCIFAQENVSVTVNKLESELKQDGIPEEDIGVIGEPVKEMLQRGTKKEDIKKVVEDLSQRGVKGKGLKKLMDSMNDLVKDGEDPEEAGNIVSRAAHEAKAQGLKGKDLAAKVHEAVQQRKQERQMLKEQERRGKKEQKIMKKGEEEKEENKNKDKGKGKGKK